MEKGDKNNFYGLQGWTVKTYDGYKIKYFSGLMGQYNIIVEDLDILISVFSTDKRKGRRQNFEKIVANITNTVRNIIKR